MKYIAYLVSDYFATSHTFVRREVEALRARGTEMRVFTIRGSEGEGGSDKVTKILGRPALDYAKALLVEIVRHPGRIASAWILAKNHRVPGLKAWLWAQFHFVEAVFLAHHLRRTKCGHLHNHFANSGAVVGLIASRIANIPWSITLHGISELDYPAGPLLGEKVEHAQFVACASFFMRAQAMRTVGPAHWSKLQIVRCGIDFASVPENFCKNEPDETRVICVGRFSPEKGHIGLIEALAALMREGLAFQATLVGDGPTLPAIKAAAEEAGIADRLRFTGALPAERALDEIAQSDIFVLPSLMEGLPVVLVEALACRTASLASAVAGIPELIVDGVTGLTFTASDWRDLATGLRRLSEDAELRESLQQAGRRVVEENFAIEAVAEKLSECFAQSLAAGEVSTDRG